MPIWSIEICNTRVSEAASSAGLLSGAELRLVDLRNCRESFYSHNHRAAALVSSSLGSVVSTRSSQTFFAILIIVV